MFWVQVRARWKSLTVQAKIVCRDEELKAQLDGYVQVGDIVFVLVLVPIMEVLDNLLQNRATGGSNADIEGKSLIGGGDWME